MKAARDVIEQALRENAIDTFSFAELAAEVEKALLSAPDSVRLELAGKLNPWRPMETAPKDGTKILAHCRPRYVETGRPMSFSYIDSVWWREKEFKDSIWKWRHSLNDSAAEPTHWQPLPAPPSEDKPK